MARLFLLSPAGLLWFTDAGASVKLVAPAAPIAVPTGRGETRTVPLGAAPIEADRPYVLHLRASAGPEFGLLGVDARGAPAWRRTIPGRADNADAALLFRGRSPPENLRFRVVHQRPGGFEILEATLRPLSPAFGPTKRFVAALGPLLVVGFLWRHRRRLLGACRAPDAAAEGVVSGLLFVVCLWVFTAAEVDQILDARFTTAVSQSLLERGTVVLPNDFQPTRNPRPYPLAQVGGRWVHYSASASAILDAPFVAAYRAFGIYSMTSDGRFLRHQEARILATVAAVLAALLCVVLWRLARLFLAPLPALLTTGVAAFGTQIFSTVSRPYWTHAWAVLLLASALYLVLSPRLSRIAPAYFAAATLLSWAVACRPVYALSALAVTAWVLASRRRFAGVLVATGLGWLALLLLASYTVFGGSPPYLAYHTSLIGATGRSLETLGSAALGTLISPSRGLLIFVPIAGWVLWEGTRRHRHLASRPLAEICLAAVAAHWLLLSLFAVWWGGQSFGPRLFTDALPWLFLLGVLVVAARQRGGAGLRWTVPSATLVLLLSGLSILVNTRGAVAKETWRWRSWERPPASESSFFQPAWVWNWRYPQFLAGWLPPDRDREAEPHVVEGAADDSE